jgi:hypothetical protein
MARDLRILLLTLPLGAALLGVAPPEVEPPVASPPPAAEQRAPAPVMADYDPQRAGHPVRVVAYALHPVGVILDYLIFRPCYWLGSHEPIRTLVGRDD